MNAKTNATKKANGKSAAGKGAKKSNAKAAAVEAKTPTVTTPQPARVPTTGVCPQGGDHAWTEENGERFCAKCKEPAPKADATNGKATKAQKAKPPKAEKPAASADAKPAKAPKQPKPPKPKRTTALDAAAQVLTAAKAPLNAKELITAMTEQKLWTSPAGQTPHATLYSALIREISTKGADSRFVKVDAGKFAARKAK